jgi:hypothetical protein
MSINSNVVKNYQTAEYGKFVELVDSSQFPPVSVIRLSYPDTSSAFPSNSGLGPLSSVDIYPKYAVLTHISNPEDISISLSAGNININLEDVEELVYEANTKLDVLTGVDYATSAKQDTTNTLLNVLTAKETTISLDVSAINLNTDEIESLIKESNTRLDVLTADVLDIENLLTTNNTYTSNINDYTVFTFQQTAGTNNSLSDIRNSLFSGIGGYSLGGYINSYNILLSSIDTTLKNGLDVTGGSDTPVKKIASNTLVSSFIAPSANRIYNIFGVSTANVGQYIQIYDIAGSTPSGTPSGIFFVPANSNFNFEFVKGMPFTSSQALIVNSITPIDYNGGNSDLFITVIYN